MFIRDLFEEPQQRRLVVIYPGRFQPFHQGHKDVFTTLQAKFGRNNVFIATSNKVALPKSPFSFTDKVALMNAAGVANNFIVETAEPYKLGTYPESLSFDPRNTVVLFALGAPDMERLEVDAKYTELTPTGRPSKIPQGKSVGDDKPLKTFRSFEECATADQHQYVVVVSEREKFVTIDGQKYDVSHGTECRELWNQVRNNPKSAEQYLVGLYGRATPELVHIFNKIPDTSAPPETPIADKRAPKQAKPMKAVGLKEGITEAPLDWQGTVSGTEQAAITDHTFDEAVQYIQMNYPTAKQYRVRRAEPGFRSVNNPGELRKSEVHISGVDGAVDYLQLKQNPMMSGSKQITWSIGYSWMVYENPANGIGILYYQDRGMGPDEIYIGGKTAEKHKQARQVFRDAGVLPTPKPRPPKPKTPPVNEFAPPGSNDGDDGFSEETLKRLAAQWYNGDEDPRVERTLMAAGWEIGQDEGYDDEPGVFVVRAGDVNGNSYLSWPAHELKQGVAEGFSGTRLATDPQTGEPSIIPPGGMGSYSPEALLSSLIRNLQTVVQRVEAGNATTAEYELYKSGVIKGKIEALARYQEFMQKNGRRPIAKGREVNLGEDE